MEILGIKLVEKVVVKDVLCNKCGESCAYQTSKEHSNFNSAVITPSFGYGSVLYDMEEWEVHICEDCYAGFEETFKIQPKKTNAWG